MFIIFNFEIFYYIGIKYLVYVLSLRLNYIEEDEDKRETNIYLLLL